MLAIRTASIRIARDDRRDWSKKSPESAVINRGDKAR